jgi:hypothetical protein
VDLAAGLEEAELVRNTFVLATSALSQLECLRESCRLVGMQWKLNGRTEDVEVDRIAEFRGNA